MQFLSEKGSTSNGKLLSSMIVNVTESFGQIGCQSLENRNQEVIVIVEVLVVVVVVEEEEEGKRYDDEEV